MFAKRIIAFVPRSLVFSRVDAAQPVRLIQRTRKTWRLQRFLCSVSMENGAISSILATRIRSLRGA